LNTRKDEETPQDFYSTPHEDDKICPIYLVRYPIGYDHMICTSRLQVYLHYPDPSRVV